MAPSKNRNLNIHERTFVCLKIKEFYDRDNGVFFHGGRKEVKKSTFMEVPDKKGTAEGATQGDGSTYIPRGNPDPFEKNES